MCQMEPMDSQVQNDEKKEKIRPTDIDRNWNLWGLVLAILGKEEAS